MSYNFKETIQNESIKICYWNIHGTKSEMIKNKLLDAEFIQKLKNSDIVALSELHSEEKDPFIPGYILKKTEDTQKNS